MPVFQVAARCRRGNGIANGKTPDSTYEVQSININQSINQSYFFNVA